MGLLQRVCETYDTHSNLAGIAREDHAMLLPIAHTMVAADIEVTINKEGEYVSSRIVGKNEPKIAIPVTEESIGRTVSACAHPLCDQVQYVVDYNDDKHKAYMDNYAATEGENSEYKAIRKDSDLNKTKHELYMESISAWANSEYAHEKVKSIYKYLEKNTIFKDLLDSGCIKLNVHGIPENTKAVICWIVTGVSSIEPTWLDASLFESYIKYYTNTFINGVEDLCMVSGERTVLSEKHPKGVIPLYGNAKLISSNDKTNFTYRGRFLDSKQAASIGYMASQKAHITLRWLAGEDSFREIYGGRIILCWNPQGKKIIQPANPLIKKKNDYKIIPSEYKDALYKTVMSIKSESQFNENEPIVVAALDAVTTGRLSVTYYSEYRASDFLKRMHYWDETTSWNHSKDGVSAPSLLDYVSCAFGTERKEKFEVDDKVKAQQMQRLIAVKLDGGIFPADIERALVHKSSNLKVIEGKNRKKLLFTTCSAIRKFRKDRFKEEWDMSLEENKKDISYQYGRLLAIMEKIEIDTYKDGGERETNAIRLQTVFSRRPQYATRIIMEQLKKAYMPRLNPGAKKYYEKLIGEIMEMISKFSDDEQRKALGDTYLLGYYLQRNRLYTKRDNKEE